MAALAYTSAIQERIANRFGGSAYSGLTANQKICMDGTWTTGTPGGYALDALTFIQQVGQSFSLTTPANVPEEWAQWLVAKTVHLMSQQFDPDRENFYFQQLESAEMAAIDAYQRNAITYDPGATPEATALTVQNIRYHVAHFVCRRQRWETLEGGARRVRPRIFVPPEVTDGQISRVMNELWNRADWMFRRRKVTMTLTSGSVVTFDLAAGETYHSMACREWYYDTSGGTQLKLSWAKDGTAMSYLRARYASGVVSTGQPVVFRVQEASGTLTWDFYPPPDATYTAKGEVYIKAPVLTSLTDTTTALAKFPVEFTQPIKDRVLAEVLRHYGDPEGKRFWDQTEAEFEALLPIFSNVGNQDDSTTIRDAYSDAAQFTDWNNVMGGDL